MWICALRPQTLGCTDTERLEEKERLPCRRAQDDDCARGWTEVRNLGRQKEGSPARGEPGSFPVSLLLPASLLEGAGWVGQLS